MHVYEAVWLYSNIFYSYYIRMSSCISRCIYIDYKSCRLVAREFSQPGLKHHISDHISWDACFKTLNAFTAMTIDTSVVSLQ